MKAKTQSKRLTFFIIISVALISVFVALTKMFPYVLDDWAWSGELGNQRFATMFADYNGRYFGNFLILAISRVEVLKIIVMSISFYIACLLPMLFANKRKSSIFVLSSLLFILIPKEIFVQVVAWASGYTNYMPPILLTTIYYIIIKNIFSDDKPKYSKITPVITLIIGVSAGLFMENVTLTNIAVAFLVIGYTFIKHRKFYATQISFFVGSIIGAIVMFTNTSYGIIASKGDSYRSIASNDSETSIVDTIIKHLEISIKQLFVNNIAMLTVATIICIVICALFIKNQDKIIAKVISILIALANVGSLVILVLYHNHPNAVLISEKITRLGSIAAAGLYAFTLFLIIAVCVTDKNEKFKQLLVFVTIPILVAPLLIVNPVTARCFYPPYFMMSLLLVAMLDYIAKVTKKDFKKLEIGIIPVMIVAAVVVLVGYFSIYSAVYSTTQLNKEYIEKQVTNNESIVYISSYPDKSYLWLSEPINKYWTGIYKDYHGIDQDTKLKFLEPEEFIEFADNYQ